ncbi:S8 family serine peptidase [Cellulosilyticum ruminicola]|uniref:S8 family serine peptidase n=1 Tax=Cellulosilyticum ruminicola TaxID=425254 RepID=UPI00278C52D9|nr:S8 family serine peptidase [Cellulosilyticum ruminicola]
MSRKKLSSKILANQEQIQEQIINTINSNATFEYSYKNLLNGFSATINKDDIEKIRCLKGVKNIYPSTSYQLSQTSIQESSNQNSSLLSQFSEGNFPYKGEGTVIALLDSDLDTEHELMTLNDTSLCALSKSDVLNKLPSLSINSQNILVDDVYKSSKIPFAYDYANLDSNTHSNYTHGTHVAGILAANKSGNPTKFDGIAPEAQLIAFKIFDDTGRGNDITLCAALEDAITLNADVINISSGLDAGFSNSPYIDYTTIFNRASDAGISIICSSGNINRTGISSYYHYQNNIVAPLTTNPDYGLASSPAIIPTAIAVASSSDAQTPSNFSSWGVTSDLSIKPEISAPGENIYSTLPNNTYGTYTGTSMATPYITGCSDLLAQYLNHTNTFEGYSFTKSKLIKTLLMNTAKPLIDSTTSLPYSPRKQGAGLVNLLGASNVKVLVYNSQNYEPKVDLGYQLNSSFSFNVILQNFSDISTTFYVTSSIFTDNYSNYGSSNLPNFITDHAYPLSNAKIQLNDSVKNINCTTPSSLNIISSTTPESITVDANSSLNICVKVSLPISDIDQLEQVFTNGFFIDGYLTFYSTEHTTLNIPYVGFYGNWKDAPIFDHYIYDSGYYYANQLASTSIIENNASVTTILGTNPYRNDYYFDSKLIAISPNNDHNGDKINLMIDFSYLT